MLGFYDLFLVKCIRVILRQNCTIVSCYIRHQVLLSKFMVLMNQTNTVSKLMRNGDCSICVSQTTPLNNDLMPIMVICQTSNIINKYVIHQNNICGSVKMFVLLFRVIQYRIRSGTPHCCRCEVRNRCGSQLDGGTVVVGISFFNRRAEAASNTLQI